LTDYQNISFIFISLKKEAKAFRIKNIDGCFAKNEEKNTQQCECTDQYFYSEHP
jgi:hypothetical protein